VASARISRGDIAWTPRHRGGHRIGAMKKLIILTLLVALGVLAARRLREA
jgi:hypothetical protein